MGDDRGMRKLRDNKRWHCRPVHAAELIQCGEHVDPLLPAPPGHTLFLLVTCFRPTLVISLLLLKPVVYPAKQAPRCILGERIAGFALLNTYVGVSYGCGRDENSCSRWELDHKPQIPQNKMASSGGVKIPKRSDRAPAKWQIVDIFVRKANGLRAKVESGTREYAVGEVPTKARVAVK